MKRSSATRLAACLLTLLPLAACFGGAASPRPPNIVLILIDDLGFEDLGVTGNRFHETPAIDALAAQGMQFTSAYSNGPNCSPSRASIVTGQYPARHGVVTVGASAKGPMAPGRSIEPVENRRRFDENTVGLARPLKQAGYATALFGKWHLRPAGTPEGMGFYVVVQRRELGYPEHEHVRQVASDDGVRDEYMVDRLTDEALRFIGEHRDDPFFLFLSHYSVHQPIQADPATIRKYRKKIDDRRLDPNYAAMLEGVDDSVARILERLDELELAGDTMVVFTSDNGGVVGFSETIRGGKGMLYEGGIRVPLIVRWPGRTTAGSVSDVPVIGADLYPTLLEIAGVPRPEKQVIDGVSLVPLLDGKTELERDAIYWHFPAYTRYESPVSVVRSGSWKLIERLDDGRLELYDLDRDPAERRNLAEEDAEKSREMLTLLRRWREEIDAPMPTPREPQPPSAR